MKDILPFSAIVAFILILVGVSLSLTLILSFVVFPIVLYVTLILYDHLQSKSDVQVSTSSQSFVRKENSRKTIQVSEFDKSQNWRSNYDFDGVINDLSKTMKKTLQTALLNNNECECRKNTLNALNDRKLCNETGKLTSQGWVTAIALSSLKRQLEELSLSCMEINLPYKKDPEIAVRDFLLNRQNYKKVCFAEGGDIRILLYCMCFTETLAAKRALPYSDESSIRGSMYTCPFGHSPLSKEETLTAISKAKVSDIKYAFYTIKEWQRERGWEGDSWPFHNYSGLNFSFLNLLFRSLGNGTLVRIAEMYLKDPYAYHKGWPDLTAIDRNNHVKLFEIKTTDKLHSSQIITIFSMEKFLPIEIIKVG